jgi:hypothetical protein
MNNLKNLSIEELEKLRDEISLLLFLKENTDSIDEDVVLFYDIIRNGLGKDYPSLYIIKQTKKSLYNKIVETHKNVVTFFGTHIKITSNVKIKIYRLFTKIMILYLKRANLLVSLNTIIQIGKNDFDVILDLFYPDYISSGLVDLILEDNIGKKR